MEKNGVDSSDLPCFVRDRIDEFRDRFFVRQRNVESGESLLTEFAHRCRECLGENVQRFVAAVKTLQFVRLPVQERGKRMCDGMPDDGESPHDSELVD